MACERWKRPPRTTSSRSTTNNNIYIYIYNMYIYIICIYDPVLRPRAPPPEWVGSTQEKGKKQYVSLCRSLTTRITCIHTDTQTMHTHIHTYIQIHTYTHTCMYIQTRPPPTHRGGAGGRPLVTDQPPCTYRPLCTHTLWWGGGGARRAGSYMQHVILVILLYVPLQGCEVAYSERLALLRSEIMSPASWRASSVSRY